MKVVYITYPFFLDFSIEYIKELSKRVELHVYVLTSEDKLSGTIFKIDGLPEREKVSHPFEEIKGMLKDANYFESYLKDCKRFDLVFFPKKRVGMKGLQKNRQFAKLINGIRPDVVHFDDISILLFAMPFFLKVKNWVIDVHDPKPHSGEADWRRKMIRTLMYPRAKKFLTYSAHSKRTFESIYGISKPVNNLSLVPYTFYDRYKELATEQLIEGEYLLFIGRVSAYKGVSDLLEAFKIISKEYPKIKLVIAGKWKSNFSVEEDVISDQVIIIDRFLENEEVAGLIRKSKGVICPYKDATQSGVVMTALGLRKEIIVSNVGGLPETIINGNGIVYDRNKEDGLLKAIKQLLDRKKSGEKITLSPEILPPYNVDKLIKFYQETY
ncbi:glycosyltransferase family 4 protein [Echinicola sp. CAU 1574]|uniref:Glycosyltransferase family 4 protein n=1 Tax=Echinicola arenosa TaxID=2774144 RepID=A0ABR9AQ21_9BACT|nr:glycosyltransferase family 4 protein [Echinicola arenosa]MBD8490898.1 glycosyltransferase family 4 protein [Echinicola arenosa]